MKHYSAQNNAFYADEFRADYEAAGSWPADAVEVSEATFREYSGQPPEGFERKPDADGAPSWVAIPPEPLADRQKRLKADIDRAAGRARARFVSPGDLIDQEYREAEAAAKQWQADGEPSTAVPPEVQAWADASDMTPSAAAQDVIDTGAQWRQVLSQVRAYRLQGKAEVENAATDEDAETAAAAAIASLDAMQPA